MEAYPQEYVAHNVPLLALSGLGEPSKSDNGSQNGSYNQGHGVRIASDLPILGEAKATLIRDEFMTADGNSLPWNATGHSDRPELIGYKIRCVGRVGMVMITLYALPVQRVLIRPSSRNTCFRLERRRHHRTGLRLLVILQQPPPPLLVRICTRRSLHCRRPRHCFQMAFYHPIGLRSINTTCLPSSSPSLTSAQTSPLLLCRITSLNTTLVLSRRRSPSLALRQDMRLCSSPTRPPSQLQSSKIA